MMRTLTLTAAIALAAGLTTAAVADRKPKLDPQAKFEQAVAGLTAGKPIDCLNERTSSRLDAAGPRLIYRVSKSLVYVNMTNGGCEGVARGDTLITNSYGSGGLCRGDIARTVDLPSRIPTGSCALGSFTPYRKP